MSGDLIIFLSAAGAFLVGAYFERWRVKFARQAWRKRRGHASTVTRLPVRDRSPVLDASDQLRIVMDARFEKRRLLSKSEARVFYWAEDAVRRLKLTWRVMAQVSLGEVLASPDARAYGAVNSKRVDVLLVSSAGEPIAAVEFQGEGHYQGSAPARDAVKKEALRRAGVGYIEVTPKHGPKDLEREIARLAS